MGPSLTRNTNTSPHSVSRAVLTAVVMAMVWALAVAASAQTAPSAGPDPTVSQADITNLSDRIGGLADADEATVSDYRKRVAALSTTLANTERARDTAERLREVKATAAQTQADLSAQIEELRNREPIEDDATMTSERLLEIETTLADAEARLAELTADANRIAQERQELVGRSPRLSQEIAQARDDLARINDQLQQTEEGATSIEDTLRRLSLLANRDLRLAEIARLDADNASVFERSQTLQLRAELTALEQAFLIEEVEALQRQTGQRRVARVRELRRANLFEVAQVDEHPLVGHIASQNLDYIGQLDELAERGADLPEQRARAQQQLSNVTDNLAIATQLTELGDLQRAGETLRRLRASLPVISSIRADIEDTRGIIIRSGTDQLLAQEQLRELPLRRVDPEALLQQYRRVEGAEVPPLTEAQAAAVRDLYELRRRILIETQQAATARANDATQLKLTQDELLDRATELQGVLDRNLLKARSAEPVFSVAYPGKVVRGTLKMLSPQRGLLVLRTLRDQFTVASFPLVVAMVLWVLSFAFFAMRASIRESIAEAATVVRRVREDSYFVTPRVAMESLLLAAPVPLAIFALGYLISAAGSANPFVSGTASALRYLALFLFAFLSLRAWAQKDGLFEKHIRIPADLRRGIQVESQWFIPVAGTAFAVMAATNRSRDIDIYEGVALTAFIIAALALGFFLYRLILGRREAFSKTLDPDGSIYKYRHVLSAIVIGTPFIAAVFAATGYFSTTEEVLQRFIETLYLAILTFILFGILRRTVNITHRRLSLKQAMEKREAAIKARQEQKAAEGDEPDAEAKAPPPVDYEQIDLEETSRQTRQLISTATIIGFFVLVWIIWRDLLPALSVFDSVELYQIGERFEGEGDAAVRVIDYITLWDVIQALVTVALTVLAARNLPGFLEIFVLNRTQLTSGVRYAIVTMMGYFIVGLGIFIALNQLGVQWGSLGFIVAALSLGIGFGLQEVIANFISGIIILFERPIRVGDYVTVGDQAGTVSNIRIRATTLTDLDNKEILIPNKEFITSRVTNWTLTNSIIRLIIPVGIAYGSDTRHAQKIMLDVLKGEPKVLDKPAPQVIFVNFGDSSLDFELRVFIRSFEDRFPVINAVHTAVNLALEREGIGIPFPQRDLHVVSAEGLRLPISKAFEDDGHDPSGLGDEPEPAMGSKLSKTKDKPSGFNVDKRVRNDLALDD